MTKQIIYIGGYGRSGSTLLDIILGDIIANTGELARLPLLAFENRVYCTCGKTFRKCEIWSGVLQKYDHNELYELHKTFRSTGGILSLLASLINAKNVKRRTTRDTFISFYSKIFSAYHTDSIIESSKTSLYWHARPLYLKLICGYQVKLLHLVRDPRAVYKSRKKCKNVLSSHETTTIPLVWPRTIISWFLANLSAMQTRLLLGRDNYLLIRYEDLIADPETELRKIGAFLDTDVNKILNKIDNNQFFFPNHLVGGNRMARKGGIRLGKNASPHLAMPAWKQAVTWLALFPVSFWLGYPIVDFSQQTPEHEPRRAKPTLPGKILGKDEKSREAASKKNY